MRHAHTPDVCGGDLEKTKQRQCPRAPINHLSVILVQALLYESGSCQVSVSAFEDDLVQLEAKLHNLFCSLERCFCIFVCCKMTWGESHFSTLGI